MVERIRHCPDPATWTARILSKVTTTEPGVCWIWTASTDRWGYGLMRFTIDGKQRCLGAHRAAWLALRGDIAGDLTIDHLCRVRNCINPEHLEPVTNSVNIQRAMNATRETRRALRRHEPGSRLRGCRKHGFENGSVVVASSGAVRWNCRPCAKIRRQRHRNAHQN